MPKGGIQRPQRIPSQPSRPLAIRLNRTCVIASRLPAYYSLRRFGRLRTITYILFTWLCQLSLLAPFAHSLRLPAKGTGAQGGGKTDGLPLGLCWGKCKDSRLLGHFLTIGFYFFLRGKSLFFREFLRSSTKGPWFGLWLLWGESLQALSFSLLIVLVFLH